MDKITTINDKIEKLKKQKARVQTQEAILFRREVEKIFEKDFSPELALTMLSDWNSASETKKKEWATRSYSFRSIILQRIQQPTETHHPTTHQNGKTSTAENG